MPNKDVFEATAYRIKLSDILVVEDQDGDEWLLVPSDTEMVAPVIVDPENEMIYDPVDSMESA